MKKYLVIIALFISDYACGQRFLVYKITSSVLSRAATGSSVATGAYDFYMQFYEKKNTPIFEELCYSCRVYEKTSTLSSVFVLIRKGGYLNALKDEFTLKESTRTIFILFDNKEQYEEELYLIKGTYKFNELAQSWSAWGANESRLLIKPMTYVINYPEKVLLRGFRVFVE